MTTPKDQMPAVIHCRADSRHTGTYCDIDDGGVQYTRGDAYDALNAMWKGALEANAKLKQERELLARAWVLLDDFNYDVPPISENFEQVQTGLELARRIVMGE